METPYAGFARSYAVRGLWMEVPGTTRLRPVAKWCGTVLVAVRAVADRGSRCGSRGTRFVVLSKLVLIAAKAHSVDGAFDAVGELVRLLQLTAFLEVVHAALGLVPSGSFTTLLQWGGRYHWIAAVVCKIKEVQDLNSVFITFAAWALSEVIRYPQYALNTLGICPRWLTWLRYTAFIPLYPIGALAGEAMLLYQALPFIKKKHLYQETFKYLPFNYYQFVTVVLVAYPFLWLMLYLHMFKQRSHKLARLTGRSKSYHKSD